MKKKIYKRIISLLLALALIAGCGYVQGSAADVFASDEESEVYEETYIPDADELGDNDDLFAEYFESVLYEDIEEESEDTSADAGIATVSDYGSSYFPDGSGSYSLYSKLKSAASEIAQSGGSTKITFSSYPTFTYTNSDGSDSETFLASALSQFKEDVSEVIDCLLADCPSELYWYDKTTGLSYAYYTPVISSSGKTCSISMSYVKMSVASAYRGTDDDGNTSQYIVDPDTAQAASEVVANASLVVSQYASYSDYEKLAAYKEWICENVSYNSDAVSSDYTDGYGDPWQIIYVFDGDADTNVVCEGYSKAFQYLCDLSTFESSLINCYTVTGTLSGGGHMWNIVRMDDGSYYLADITNSDSGTVGSYGGLFLAGTDNGSADTGYTFSLSGTYTSGGVTYGYYSSVTYIYYDDTLSLYGSDILTLAASDYESDDTDSGTEGGDDTTEGGDDTSSGDDTSGDESSGGDDTSDEETEKEKSAVSITANDVSVTYSGTDIDVSAAGLFDIDENAGDASYSVTALTGKGSFDADTNLLSVTGIGTFSVIVETEETDEYEAASKAAILTVSAKSISSASVSLSYTSCTYSGSAKKPTPTVKITLGGKTKTLTSGTDFSVSYSNNVNAGTAKVTITGKGNYTGTVTKTFTINKRSITSASLSSISYTYSGSVKTPSVTVKNSSGTKLTKGTHYTVTYSSGRKNIGTYKVTVKGTGNYTGTITKTFKIVPKTMSVKSLKSSSKKKITVKWTKTSGSVTKYQIRYRVKGTSTWKTKTVSSSSSSTTLTGLKSKKTYQVQIRAYKTVSGTTYYGAWSSTKTVKVK